MWHLEKPTQQTLDAYVKKLLPKLRERIYTSALAQGEKDVLLPPTTGGTVSESILTQLLSLEPEPLFQLSERLMRQLIPDYNFDELSDLSKARKTLHPSQEQVELKSKYAKVKELEMIFGYDQVLSQNKSRSYRIAAAANHNTCVYCNRQYTFNIVKDKGKNDDERIARAELDHWFPKSLFPLMSLSYYNLIPCCKVCNSSVKSDTIWQLETHVHPYITTAVEPTFKFRYKAGLNSTWDIDFENLSGKEEQTVKDLCIKEAYQAHSSLEVADLIELASKNNGTYMKQLYDTILRLYADGTDNAKAYRLLLGTELMPQAYKNRPMSKLKRDIVEQIERVKGIRIIE